MQAGVNGFGFVLRNSSGHNTLDTSLSSFHSTADRPSPHQLIEVEAGSPADEAGLRTGDFLLEVGGCSVVALSCEDTVNLIRSYGSRLSLGVVTRQNCFIDDNSSTASTSQRRPSHCISDDVDSSSLSYCSNTSDNVGVQQRHQPSNTDFTAAETDDVQNKVASIRSVHGKRLTSSIPLKALFSTPSADFQQVGNVQRRADDESLSSGHITARRASADCHITANGPSTPSRFSQQTTGSRDDSLLGRGEQMKLNGRDVVKNGDDSSPADSTQLHISLGQLVSVPTRPRQFSAGSAVTPSVTMVRPSPRSEFGRRRRPISVIETTSRMLPTPPLPPPHTSRPPLPDHVHGHRDRTRETSPQNSSSNQHLQLYGPTLAQLSPLRDLRQQTVATNFGTECSRDCNSVATSCSESSVPVTQFKDVSEKHNACNSVLNTFTVHRPTDQYTVPTVVRHFDDTTRSEVCADVGSCARRLSQLKTFNERQKHDLQPDVPDSSAISTVEKDISSYDFTSSITRPSESCPRRQDSPFTHVIPSATVHIGDSDAAAAAAADIQENLALDNDESAISDDIVLPPPPEFDDALLSCVTHESDCHFNSVRDFAVSDWSVGAVCSWLEAVGLREHGASFRIGNVDGSRLRTLGRSELIAFGLTDVHDRMKFERALRKAMNSN